MSTNLFSGLQPLAGASGLFPIPNPPTGTATTSSSSSQVKISTPFLSQVKPIRNTAYDKHRAAAPLHSVTAQGEGPTNVVIEVGPERKRYHVQKAFLMHYSDYFNKALSGTWKEAKEGVVSLDDIEPAVFNLFVEWLYTQQVPSSYSDFCLIGGVKTKFLKLWEIELYVFADRFAVSALRTAMNRQIVKEANPAKRLLWHFAHVIYAFDNLPPTDPLLDFFVDQYFIGWDGQMTSTDALPQDFLQRFFKRVGDERKKGFGWASSVFEIDACSYHEHATDADKTSCSHRSMLSAGKLALMRPIRSETPLKIMVDFGPPPTSSS